MYPDIVVHQRGFDDNNELVIEVKKSNRGNTIDDKDKLCKFTDPQGEYRYKLGLFLVFKVGKRNGLKHAECYQDGEKQCGEKQSCSCRSLVESFGSSQSDQRIDR